MRICQTYTDVVTDRTDPLGACTGFERDEANAVKNWERHRVTTDEAESVFFHEPWSSAAMSVIRGGEKVLCAGQTSAGRRLFVAFTIRRALLRVISVRDMNRKERDAMPSTKQKPVPEFQTEDEEREFWAKHDSTDFIDWHSAQRRKLPNLKPTLRTISLRLPVAIIEDLKVLANKKDVPYQSLLKVFLAERLERERRRA